MGRWLRLTLLFALAVVGAGFALVTFIEYRRGEHQLGSVMLLGSAPIWMAVAYLLSLM